MPDDVRADRLVVPTPPSPPGDAPDDPARSMAVETATVRTVEDRPLQAAAERQVYPSGGARVSRIVTILPLLVTMVDARRLRSKPSFSIPGSVDSETRNPFSASSRRESVLSRVVEAGGVKRAPMPVDSSAPVLSELQRHIKEG
jgi:hypothetical protein